MSCSVNTYQTSLTELNLPPKCYVGNDKEDSSGTGSNDMRSVEFLAR